MEIVKDTYSKLLNYFDSRYGSDTERTNYAHVIKSMQEEHKVKSLMGIYNKVLKKLLRTVYGSEENISDSWVRYGLSRDQWAWEELKACLNDQIKRIFDETSYSDQLAIECITNLRSGHNEGIIRKYILSKSSEVVNVAMKRIMDCKQTIHEAPKHISKFNIETNEYREYKPKYIKDIKFLVKNGYYRGYDDISFEIQAKITYFPDSESVWRLILYMIIIIPIIMLLMYFAFKVVFAVICVIAILKMIVK
jgi:hypothetical protein